MGLLSRSMYAVAVAALLTDGALCHSTTPEIPIQAKWTLEAGDAVPVLKGRSADGKAFEYDFAKQQRETVVYVISPFSTFVVQNEARFSSLMRQVGEKYNWLIVSPNEPRFGEYINKIRPTWAVKNAVAVTGISPQLKKEMMLGAYPQTLVISRQGKVLQNFMGPYTEDSMSAQPDVLEKFFGVKVAKEHRHSQRVSAPRMILGGDDVMSLAWV